MASSRNNKIGSSPRRVQNNAPGIGKGEPGRDAGRVRHCRRAQGQEYALHGNAQRNVPSERQDQAGADADTDELLESFRKTGKHYRADAQAQKRTAHRH